MQLPASKSRVIVTCLAADPTTRVIVTCLATDPMTKTTAQNAIAVISPEMQFGICFGLNTLLITLQLW